MGRSARCADACSGRPEISYSASCWVLRGGTDHSTLLAPLTVLTSDARQGRGLGTVTPHRPTDRQGTTVTATHATDLAATSLHTEETSNLILRHALWSAAPSRGTKGSERSDVRLGAWEAQCELCAWCAEPIDPDATDDERLEADRLVTGEGLPYRDGTARCERETASCAARCNCGYVAGNVVAAHARCNRATAVDPGRRYTLDTEDVASVLATLPDPSVVAEAARHYGKLRREAEAARKAARKAARDL